MQGYRLGFAFLTGLPGFFGFFATAAGFFGRALPVFDFAADFFLADFWAAFAPAFIPR